MTSGVCVPTELSSLADWPVRQAVNKMINANTLLNKLINLPLILMYAAFPNVLAAKNLILVVFGQYLHGISF
jgi:hypothetical protein